MRRSLGVLGTLASLLFVCASACSSATGTRSQVGSGGSGATGAGGSGAGAGAGGFNPGGGSGGLPQGCAKDKYTGELLPLDMFVMLDRSGSMKDDTPSKWSAVTGALNNFVSLPGISGLGMGIGFFPTKPAVPPPAACTTDPQCGVYGPCVPGFNTCTGGLSPNDSCVDTDYAKPVVGIAPLPGVAGAITSAIGGQSPDGASTPTDAAEHGAIEYAQSWAKNHPDDITIVVLATDGEPNNCNPNSVATVAARAEQGYTNKPSIKTFVIGVGSAVPDLNLIAQKGGTTQAVIVNGSNAGQQFLDALNQIRGSVGCVLKIPQPTSGTPDYGRVNVAFTPAGGQQQYFPQTQDGKQDGCKGDKKWYYDDPNNPTHIVLCPAACDLISNTKGETDVVVGCLTIVH